MIQEIQTISLASAYDYIKLDKYTNNKDSIKVKFKDTGEEFTNWSLTDSGQLRIENGVLDYKKYDNHYTIKVIVEYEPSPLPLTLDDINTLEGLKTHVVDLKSLDYISTLRLIAYEKFNLKLNEFVLFNTVLFNQYGQVTRVLHECQDKYLCLEDKILTLEEFDNLVETYSCVYDAIPKSTSICPHCKQKWTLSNLKDCIRQDNLMYHIECNRFSLYEKAKKEFDYIVSRVFDTYTIHGVKNEYGSEDYNGCWFVVTTPDGDIRIGWRKRVIQIEWLDNYKPFKFNGGEEDVTNQFLGNKRYIHAWDTEDAIKYLTQAKRTIIY